MLATGPIVIAGGLIVFLLTVSAFFSSSEIAIFSQSKHDIEQAHRRGDTSVAWLWQLRSNDHRLLVTLLTANNIVNIAITAITAVVFAQAVRPGIATVAATVLASVLILVFGEILPKVYGLGHADTWARRVAHPIAIIQSLFLPVVVVLEGLTTLMSEYITGDPEIERPYERPE